MEKKGIVLIIVLVFSLCTGSGLTADTTAMERLGGLIYRDVNLSVNKNQSCQTCHHKSAGFADPGNSSDPYEFPVSEGSISGIFGARNAPTSAYAGFSPPRYQAESGDWYGGLFWDSRAAGLSDLGDPLAEQAQGPFLNPKEMAMENAAAVVREVEDSRYVRLFINVFPDTDFSDIQKTFADIARAIAAFERSASVTRFGSKFDAFWQACRDAGIDIDTIDTSTNLSTLPQGFLSSGQLKGLALFNDPGKGNCAACHATSDYIDAQGNRFPPLFTNFAYHNIGIPTNPRVEELSGVGPPDYGLGPVVNDTNQNGKFKVPTLRNADKSAPYGHNGYFPTLVEIVNFKNTRDVGGVWEQPEVGENLNTTDLGDLGLSRREEGFIVNFLRSLTDMGP